MSSVDEVYAALLGLDVPGASQPWPVDRPDPAIWHELVARCTAERVLGTLADAVARGLIVVDEPARAALAAEHTAAMTTALVIERQLLEVASWLRNAGVEFIVLKGPAIVHTLYRTPSQREFIDIDLLVRDIDAAVACLVARGAIRRAGQLRPGYDRRFAKAVTMVAPATDIELDVHRTLAPGPFGVMIEPGDLFSRTQTFDLADVALPALDRTAQFVHSCYHVALGSAAPRGSNLRDVALGLADRSLDPTAVRALAARWRGEAVVASAIRACVNRVPMQATPLTEWARAYETGPRDEKLLAVYAATGSRFAALALATMRTLRWPDRARFALAVALPSADNLRSRSLDRLAHLRRLTADRVRARRNP